MSAPGLTGRFELLTPRGVGGIAVIVVGGPDRGLVLAAVVRGVDGRGTTACARPTLVVVVIDGEVLDQAILVDRPDSSVTELHVHGSPAVLDAIEVAVGGFVRSAASRAEELLRRATTHAQLGLAIEQLSLPTWRDRVAELRGLAAEVHARELDALRDRSRVARALHMPCRTVLVGHQNAGKSTLLNRLVFRDRAMTGPQAGLTRDPVREDVELDGYPYLLIDTAGEGAHDDPLDRLAVERGRRERDGALLVLVADGSLPFGVVERDLVAGAALVVRTKSDLGHSADWPELPCPAIAVCALDERDAVHVRAAVGRELRAVRRLPQAPLDGVGGVIAWSDDDLAELDRCRDASRD